MSYSAEINILFLILLFVVSSGIIRADFGDILSNDEQEVERLILGARGALHFANQVQDVIEGASCGRVYLARVGEAPEMILEKTGQVIDSVWYIDFTGDSLKEVALSWKYTGQNGYMRFEVFSVTPSGRLSRLFPSPDAKSFESSGSVRINDVEPGLLNGAVFSLRRSLCEITKAAPQLTVVTSYRWDGSSFVVSSEVTEEPETIGQRLNFAAHNFSKGDFKKGLEVARSTLEGVRISGPRDLLGDAYSLVARGYKLCGKPELAALYEKRASLTFNSEP
jgi:hypothetical protein